VKEANSGLVFLRGVKIVHAETTSVRSRDALCEIVNWDLVEFAYEHSVRSPLATIHAPWHEALIDIFTGPKEADPQKPQRQSA
jgi:hypothetical protein